VAQKTELVVDTQFTNVLNKPVQEAARLLLGSELVRTINGEIIRVRIVETEAYDQTDAASHSYKGRTPRTDIMFGPAGRLYVYFTYGMHYCCNVVVGEEGYGAAVLIRAVEPIEGEGILRQRRNKSGIELTNGPAKLCQALDIDKTMNGHDLRTSPLRLRIRTPLVDEDIVITTRIGISQAKEQPWRFYIKNSQYVSHKI
jgi:DNA-3-methyladenine glycosylase